MAYTIEITNGTTTVTFDAGKQPHFRPKYNWRYNEDREPHVRSEEIETWALEGITVTGTDSAVTTNVADLLTLLRNRAVPVNSVKFKRDTTVVFELETTTYKGGVLVRSLDPAEGGPGQWATHWRGTLVVEARRFLDDGTGIVSETKEKSYAYDAAGLATVTQRGTVRTVPGTSAEAKARARALASPGSAYGLVTAGPSDEPSVTILDETDTAASYESAWREHGVSLPAGVNDYDLAVDTAQDPEMGERVTTRVRAKGPTNSQQKTAVQKQKPTTNLVAADEAEDKVAVEWSGTYVQERPSQATKDRTGSDAIVYHRREFTIDGADEGEDRDAAWELIPGALPFATAEPRKPKVVRERVISKIRGTWSSLDDFRLGAMAATVSGLRRQPGQTQITMPTLEQQGITKDGDLWRAEVTYVFAGDAIDLTALAGLAAQSGAAGDLVL